MSTNGEKIVLGSGKLFTMVYAGETIPTNALIEAEENLLGLISGGAEVTYKPKFYTAKDDLGLKIKTILTEEEALLKSGIMTWCGKTLKKICSTARVSEVAGKRTVLIGGISNQDGLMYVIRFVHEDAIDGDIRVTIIGNNQAGFGFKFAKDKETVVDVEFIASPMDATGTLIMYEEDIPTV